MVSEFSRMLQNIPKLFESYRWYLNYNHRKASQFSLHSKFQNRLESFRTIWKPLFTFWNIPNLLEPSKTNLKPFLRLFRIVNNISLSLFIFLEFSRRLLIKKNNNNIRSFRPPEIKYRNLLATLANLEKNESTSRNQILFKLI